MIARKDFPEGFLFGAATSAYQIEGHRFGGAGPSIWDVFAAQPGKVVNGETGATACDHYHRYEADLDLLKGLDAYRFSTSWARVMPDGRTVNQAGLDFYDRLVDAILARGLQPFLTLYHWDMPAALGALGGWENRDVASWFGDFTDTVMDRIGDRVASTATINEPWCVSWLSHFLGHHAPGKQDITAAARAVHHVLLAHAEAMERLRARGQKNLGIVLNFEAFQPATPQDQPAAARFDAIMNRMFIEPLTKGHYPDLMLEGLAPHLPENWQDDMARISAPLDWLGVNYYTRQTIAEASGPWPNYTMAQTDAPKTQMGWDIYPAGLSETLQMLKDNYIENLPIYITENGMAWDDTMQNGTVDDLARTNYLFDHLAQVKSARAEGANIQGYFYWSLLDNYEWAFGYEKRFGMIYVDFETLQRVPKNSFYTLKKWLSPGS
ncbi:MAG: beta-glucosidase [Rhodobacteraceae bacterium]|nr:beta-glucosidase [Paracoccaceae bacterium]